MKCYVFDLDGTLADDRHRHHHVTQKSDWDAYYAACPDDKPIEHLLAVARSLQKCGYAIMIVTGRSEAVRKETEAWLMAHGILWTKLYMRLRGDRRKNSDYKLSVVTSLRSLGYDIQMVFEDLAPAVKVYRSIGIPCAQVADAPYWNLPHP